MIPLGLNAADTRTYRQALRSAHRARVRVEIRTLGNDPVGWLTPYLADGLVTLDWSADVTRGATLVFNDPHRSLPFDTDHPADTALFLDRLIRVTYDVQTADGDNWVGCPVFTGPVTGLSRDGDQVTAECQGKELLAMGSFWEPFTLPRGTKKTDAIRRLLSEKAGEDRFDIPDLPARLPRPLSFHREGVPWAAARKIARSMGRELFYDGRGFVRLRHLPGTVGFTFHGDADVTSPIQIDYSNHVVNAVFVVGGVPKGAKTQVQAFAVAPANHPLSPTRLGRNGAPRYLMPDGAVVRDDSIKTVAEAQAVADRHLKDGLLQGVNVSFDSIPIPFLDPGDMCHVETDDGSVTFRLNAFTFPLTAGESMTVGYHRRLAVRHAHRHRKPVRRRRRAA